MKTQKSDRKQRYEAYMQSREWFAVRQDAFARFGHECQGCGGHRGITVHHLRYPADIYETTVHDVIPLCWKCHHAAHVSKHRAFAFTAVGADVLRVELVGRLRRLHKERIGACGEALAYQAKEKAKKVAAAEQHVKAAERRRAEHAARVIAEVQASLLRKKEKAAAPLVVARKVEERRACGLQNLRAKVVRLGLATVEQAESRSALSLRRMCRHYNRKRSHRNDDLREKLLTQIRQNPTATTHAV